MDVTSLPAQSSLGLVQLLLRGHVDNHHIQDVLVKTLANRTWTVPFENVLTLLKSNFFIASLAEYWNTGPDLPVSLSVIPPLPPLPPLPPEDIPPRPERDLLGFIFPPVSSESIEPLLAG